MNRNLVIKLDKELLVLITIIYYTSKLLWDNLIPYVFTFGFIALCGMYAVRYILSIKRKQDLLLLAYMGLFSIYIVVNAIYKDDSSQIARAVYEYIVYALPFFLILYCLPYVDMYSLSRKVIRWGALICILSWYEYFTRSHLLNIRSGNTGILYGGSYAFRASVFARSALAQGVIIGLFTIFAFSLYMNDHKKINLIYTVFFFISILTTSSRGPLVSTAAAIFAMYMIKIILLEKSSSRKIISSAIIITILMFLLFILTSDFQTGNETVDYFLLRTRNILNWESDAGNVGRLSRWNWALSLYKSNPWFGIGPSKTGSWGIDSLGVTESGVLKRLCELGIVGFGMHYFFVIIVSISSLKVIKRLNYWKVTEMMQFIGLLIMIVVNDFIVQSTEEPAVCFIMWFALAGMVYFQNSDKLIKDTI